ncbi:MAG: hypothetical protein M1817_002454 [Caeruleum heppii]|nr:MAG: hypothetical protein M1817_002454 [Caeruleum heppii]
MFGLRSWSVLTLLSALVPTVPATEAPRELYYGASCLKDVHLELLKSGIIPEVIDDFDPTVAVYPSWPANRTAVNFGNIVPIPVASPQPVVRFQAPKHADRDVRYTLVMTDPDAPSRLNFSSAEIAHWIITNITLSKGVPSAPELERLEDGPDALLSYNGPRPPPGSGAHRYVLILFKPASPTGNNDNLIVPSERRQWGTGQVRQGARPWAKLNGLVPVGANYFQAQNTSTMQ